MNSKLDTFPTKDYPWITWTQFMWVLGGICAFIVILFYINADAIVSVAESADRNKGEIVEMQKMIPVINANLNNLNNNLDELKRGLGIKITIPK